MNKPKTKMVFIQQQKYVLLLTIKAFIDSTSVRAMDETYLKWKKREKYAIWYKNEFRLKMCTNEIRLKKYTKHVDVCFHIEHIVESFFSLQ